MGKKPYYNRTNTCDRCREKDKITKLYAGNANREYDDKGNWTGRWLCDKCYSRNDYIERYKTGHRRTKNLDPNSPCGKGDRFEELTCAWRVIKNLNAENDNYTSPIDHSRDPELGILQTKGRLYDHINRCWNVDWRNEYGKEFDNLIFYCASKDGKRIERIYIFPKEEVLKRTGIAIYKNPSKGILWYEEYRVKDEDTLEIINDIWRDIIKRKRIKNGE